VRWQIVTGFRVVALQAYERCGSLVWLPHETDLELLARSLPELWLGTGIQSWLLGISECPENYRGNSSFIFRGLISELK
jgi:hypothetical protein